MNSGLKIAGIVVLGVVLVGGAAYAGGRVAQTQNPTTPANVLVGPRALTARGGWMLNYHDQMLSSLAGALGMSVDDLNSELQSGKTLAQIAQEKNISTDKLQAAMLQAESDALAQAVKDGVLTQAQADQLLAQMKQNPNLGFGYGFGMMNGFRGRGRNFNDNRRPNFGPGMRGPRFWPNQPQASPTPKGISS